MSNTYHSEQMSPFTRRLFDNVRHTPPARFSDPNQFHRHLEHIAHDASPDVTAGFYKFKSGNALREVFVAAPTNLNDRKAGWAQVNQHPHSNEVVANVTVTRVASILTEGAERFREAGLGGIVVYDADPENALRNGEALFSPGPLAIFSYFRNAYRSNAQVDLDFEGGYKGYEYKMPVDHSSRDSKLGTVALADFIKPRLYIPTHNFGLNDGSNSYVSHNSPRYNMRRAQTLRMAGMPAGSAAESPFQEKFDTGVYEHFGIRTLDQSMTANGKELAGVGLSSTDIVTALNPEAFCVTDETPYFILPANKEPISTHEAQDILLSLEQLHTRMKEILVPIDNMRTVLDTDDKKAFFESSYAPFQRWGAVIEAVKGQVERGEQLEGILRVMPFYIAISLGMANRLHEMVTGAESEPALDTLLATAERYSDAEFPSHRTLVESQLGAYAAGIEAAQLGDYQPMDVSEISVPVPSYEFPRELQQLVRG